MSEIDKVIEVLDVIKKTIEARNQARNSDRRLFMELQYNSEILKAFRGSTVEPFDDVRDKQEEESDEFTPDPNANLIKILDLLKTREFNVWLTSSRNLDSFGWTQPLHQGASKRKKTFVEALTRIYNRVNYLKTRLKLKNSTKGIKDSDLVDVKVELHFKRLRQAFCRATHYLAKWQTTPFWWRPIMNLFRVSYIPKLKEDNENC